VAATNANGLGRNPETGGPSRHVAAAAAAAAMVNAIGRGPENGVGEIGVVEGTGRGIDIAVGTRRAGAAPAAAVDHIGLDRRPPPTRISSSNSKCNRSALGRVSMIITFSNNINS